jgi:hypothetical protein
MLDDIKSLLAARYGDRWLNSVNNQNGIAEDLTIQDNDVMRASRKFGLEGRGMSLTTETEVIARYEVIRPVASLFEVDAIFYNWWGHRASENISFVQREIGDDEVQYHFITGTPTHGHSGTIVLMGRCVRHVIQKRWERRLKQLNGSTDFVTDRSITADNSANT